jgi:carboxypeptidase family protein
MRAKQRMFFAMAGILWLLLSANVAQADNVYARIRGTLTDPSEAVVPGAKIVATNTATGISKETTTGDDGSYEFLQLDAPFLYTVSAEITGFKKFEARAAFN